MYAVSTYCHCNLYVQNRQSWCRSQTVCSLQSERPTTPVYALFGMQFSLMQVRHKFLQLSIDKLKIGSAKNTLMQTAIKHLRSPQIGEFIQALNNMEHQVSECSGSGLPYLSMSNFISFSYRVMRL
jgi:hypothetical protein